MIMHYHSPGQIDLTASFCGKPSAQCVNIDSERRETGVRGSCSSSLIR